MTHSFGQGSFEVEVSVTYSISYRFAGQANWLADPGQIGMPAYVSVEVNNSVDQPFQETTPTIISKLPFLVSANCLLHGTAIGCF